MKINPNNFAGSIKIKRTDEMTLRIMKKIMKMINKKVLELTKSQIKTNKYCL